MGTKDEPCWSVYQRTQDGKGNLVAYAKRAKDSGWFVRVGNVNPNPMDEKMYIDDAVFPPDFMISMLHMTHRKPDEEEEQL
jgi:hypothetical protein